MLNLFFVFLGGAIGSLLRFELAKCFTVLFAGTFVANFAGCILLGFFYGRTKNVFFTFPVENFQNVTKKAVAFNIS